MKSLETLLDELSNLASQQQWQQILERDAEVRQAVKDFMINHSLTGSKQGEETLYEIREIYNRGVAWLESNKDKSASDMKNIHKGLTAAKSYLDLTRY